MFLTQYFVKNILFVFFSFNRNWKVKKMIKSTVASTTTKNSSSLKIQPWAMPPLAWSGVY